MTCDGPITETLSITSGYSVPWPRKSNDPSFFASSSNTSMNAAPMILRFCSGSVTPASRSRNRSDGVDEDQRQLQPLEARADLLRFVLPHHAVVDEDARQAIADRAMDQHAATVESTPPLRPHTTLPSPTCARIRRVASFTNEAIVQSPVQPQMS